MRDIKFRVWDTNFKKMLLVHDAKFADGRLIGAKGVNWDSQVIIMQFTGLKDKNGEEIWEGDICKYYQDTDDMNAGFVNLEVKWDADRASFMMGDDYTPLGNAVEEISITELEVIGNIYENPELLQEYEKEGRV